MLDYINNLSNNPAFWIFLGTLVTAYFGYKGIIKKTQPTKHKIRTASSFEELRSVVEILQNELEKKDKRHRRELETYDEKFMELEAEIREIRMERNSMIKIMHENGLSWPPEELSETEI